MSDRASLELELGTRSRGKRRIDDAPLRILLLGDFSAGAGDQAAARPRRVEFETLDAAIAAMAPTIPVSLDAPVSMGEDLAIASIDDFHPDALARSLSTFGALAELGARLSDSATRDEALSQLAELTGASSPDTPSQDPSPQADSEADGDDFERLLGAPATASPRTRAVEKVQSFIEEVMEPTRTEDDSPDAEEGRHQVAALMTATMRAVLSSSSFRNLERAWRSVEWLVRRLDDEDTQIFILDLSKPALAAELRDHAENLQASALHRIICEPDSGDAWDLLIGDYTFTLGSDDIVLLATLGAMAGQAGVPLFAHGDLSLCGCHSPEAIETPWDWALPDDDLGRLWTEFRSHPASQSVGLASPRILLRQSYGADTDPIDAFEFEELPPNPDTNRFLWGNPAIGCACLLARAHAGDAGSLAPEDFEIEDLPTVIYDDGSGEALQPPVETLLGERALKHVQDAGLIAMIGRRNANSVQCPDLYSVSTQPVSLLS